MTDPHMPGETEKKERGGLFSRRLLQGGKDRLAPRPAPQPPQKPRRKRSTWVGLLSGGLTVLVLFFAMAGVIAAIGHSEFGAAGPLPSDRALVIERGASSEDIVDMLQREGVITRPGWFWAGMLLNEATGQNRVKAGEYLIKRQASMREVMETITSGRPIQHSVTIPEGLTTMQIVARLMELDILTGEITTPPAEGSMLPDTYKFERGTTRQQMVQRMQRDHQRVVKEIWDKRAKDLPIRTANDLVILASIIEKETGRQDERTRVASVFVNRLQKNMRLQSDPTTVYGIVGGKGPLGRGLTRAELDQPTPYNTYTIGGLPPGPIANPGRASLEAAANPSRTKDLFFVADGSGGHAFAETLEQHNRNVARWRQIEAQASRPANADAPAVEPGAAPVPATVLPGGRAIAAPPNAPAQSFAPPPVRQDEPRANALGEPAPGTPARRPVIDAANGTRLDPLRNQNYDLNSPKAVPPLR